MHPVFKQITDDWRAAQYRSLDLPATRAALLVDLRAVRDYCAGCGLDAIVSALDRTQQHIAGSTDAALTQMHDVWAAQLVRLTAMAPTRGEA